MIDQEEDQKEIDINNNNSLDNNKIKINNISIYLDSETIPIIDQLVQMGFNKIYSKRLVAYYHPQNIDEALIYFLKEDEIIQHFYIEDRELIGDKICFLCGEKKEIHLGYIPENSNNDNDNNERNNIISNDILLTDLVTNDNKMNEQFISYNDETNSIKPIKKITCEICSELFIENNGNKLEKCGHSFCNECWYNFLSIKIKENKISLIKCLNYGCQEKLSDNFIFNILKSNQILIEQYKKYKYELEIMNDPNKKFCPYPNCNSYALLKDLKNKNVKCSNNHAFCFLCLEKPHGKRPCKEVLDKSIIEFSKNNFIKRCPNCGIITEKVSGCNHITCSKCNYQWCWLCNNKYNVEHFREGKCKGFQFYRPKNENDIKLAFEGKITLNASQRQQDIEDNHFHFRHHRDIRNRRHHFYDDHLEFERRINRINRRNNICSFILFLIYICTGNIINILLRIKNYNEKKEIIIHLTFLLILIINYFLQIIINLIMLVHYIVTHGTHFSFYDFQELDFFKYIVENIENFDFIICTLIYIFGGEIFFYFRKYFEKSSRKIIKLKIFYYFIEISHRFIFLPYYIIIGVISLSLELLIRKTKYIEDIKYLMN